MADTERMRLVVLGGAGVGKSCIVKRFLLKSYSDRYRPTVEDLYNREFDLGAATIRVDVLDTAGDQQFPAMRRLCIATAHAFLLVYAATSAASFQAVRRCFDEVREQRPDFQEIPIVVAGNKLDLAKTHREVSIEDVSEWLFCELPKLRAKVIECSAKDDINVKEIFRSFLTLSRILPAAGDDVSGLKRRSSAYVSATSRGARCRSGVSPPSARSLEATSHAVASEGATGGLEVAKAKPRSRSLIRRSSRKAKQQMREANDDCHVS